MGKSTISMAIFNSFLYVHQEVPLDFFGLGPRHRCVSAARSPGRCRWHWEARPTPPGAAGIVGENATGWKRMAGYPLVNVYIAMENHHFSWVNPL